MRKKIILARIVALVALAMPGAHVAYAQSPTGEIRGVVVDQAGAVLANVSVTIENPTTSLRRELTTDDAGRFTAPLLPTGPYEVSASLQGYAVRRQEDIPLYPGRTVTLRLELDTARAPDTITIGTTPRVIDSAQAHAGTTIGPAELVMLPLINRDANDLLRTLPGATGALLPVIDGVEAADQGVSLDALREISVLTAAPPAEYPGPVAALSTRGGGNRFSGSAFDFVRDSRSQFGGVLGGPIATGRHFFFAGYDGVRMATAPGATDRNVLFARTDHLLARDHRLTVRFDDDIRSRVMVSSGNALGRGLLNEVRVQGTDDYAQVADTLTFVHGAHTLRSGFDVTTNSLLGPDVDPYGFFAQDQWWVNGSTTIDGGVRFGRELLPFIGMLDTDADWQPRVGTTWNSGSGRLAVRGAYRGMGDGVHHGTAGVEWEWMPRVSISATYLEYRAGGERAGGFAAEVYRRFAQGVHYRVAYTRGTGDPASPVLAALLPRSRFSATSIYNTTTRAESSDGIARTLMTDWTVSGIVSHQTGVGVSIDPRAARDIRLGDALRVTLLWEAFNLFGNETLLTPRMHQFAARLTF